MGRRILSVAAAALMALATQASAQEKIVVGSSNWPSLQATSSILKEIAAKYFAADASVVNSTLPVILASMDKGDIDILPELWSPNHDSIIKPYADKGTVKLGSETFLVQNAVCTTKETQEKLGVKSIYDLAKPEIAEMFKKPGESKPKLWVGPAGWSSSRVEVVKARDYGYSDLFEITTVEEPLAIVDLEQALRSGTPWVGICYMPHPVFSRDDIVVLEEPPHDPSKWKMVQPDQNANWLQMSSVTTAWEPTKVYIAYSTELEKKDPKLVGLLKNVKLDSKEVAQWIETVGVKKVDPDQFAKEWVEKNDALILQWIAASGK